MMLEHFRVKHRPGDLLDEMCRQSFAPSLRKELIVRELADEIPPLKLQAFPPFPTFHPPSQDVLFQSLPQHVSLTTSDLALPLTLPPKDVQFAEAVAEIDISASGHAVICEECTGRVRSWSAAAAVAVPQYTGMGYASVGNGSAFNGSESLGCRARNSTCAYAQDKTEDGAPPCNPCH